MANWTYKFNEDIRDGDFLAIKSLFEAGHVRKMALLKEQSPTKIAKLLGLQYNSYLDKLDNPEKFTVKHIFKIALVCQIDPCLIFDIIQIEVQNK
ncbi:hypothetical protein A5893_02285 [Pedobacter psychrophilus]|uniref:Uncharacterized protein n=1 Tax=Pedobacter psychrophilus TaxID=1826909 RepID=A0A179DM38_9SPHI|nr:hypothetical protein [Pedobacter psychrophilus]OAQ41968.1 hypothetical protein A5893_02285 [Pedobacter psychrophilus]